MEKLGTSYRVLRSDSSTVDVAQFTIVWTIVVDLNIEAAELEHYPTVGLRRVKCTPELDTRRLVDVETVFASHLRKVVLNG